MMTRSALHRVHAERRRPQLDPATGMLVTWRTTDPATGRETVHARTWPNAVPHHKSPCRADSSKGLRQHRCSAAHADMVRGYRAYRDGEYALAEQVDAGTAHSPRNEPGTYWETHPRPTLKAYLQGMRDETRESAA